ncbi:CHAT domain-containing protein [Kovacikia minuta]|uniref:CHAT domain-containing protein n=1 Tax=Kovacikia minuta TaxID=2931930 RepID=UPI0020C79A58|nr:CHAT domain-containing protein [Kovacikia minuta]
MTEFYRQLQTAPIKAEALRRAQIAMLRGEVQIEAGQLRSSRGGELVLPATLTVGGKLPLFHPYYWSAFTLIGSPW